MPDYSAYYWTPQDRGYLAESGPAAQASTASALLGTAGTLNLVRLKVPQAGWCTNIVLSVQTGGASLTAGQNFAALFYANGGLLAQSTDQSTAWAGTGPLSAALAGGPYYLSSGEYYAGIWWNGTTAPTVNRYGVGLNVTNGGRSAPNLLFAVANTGLTTAAPSSFGTQTANCPPWWVALS